MITSVGNVSVLPRSDRWGFFGWQLGDFLYDADFYWATIALHCGREPAQLDLFVSNPASPAPEVSVPLSGVLWGTQWVFQETATSVEDGQLMALEAALNFISDRFEYRRARKCFTKKF